MCPAKNGGSYYSGRRGNQGVSVTNGNFSVFTLIYAPVAFHRCPGNAFFSTTEKKTTLSWFPLSSPLLSPSTLEGLRAVLGTPPLLLSDLI